MILKILTKKLNNQVPNLRGKKTTPPHLRFPKIKRRENKKVKTTQESLRSHEIQLLGLKQIIQNIQHHSPFPSHQYYQNPFLFCFLSQFTFANNVRLRLFLSLISQSRSSLALKQTELKAKCKTNPLCLSPAHLSLPPLTFSLLDLVDSESVTIFLLLFFFLFLFSVDRQI